jgi:hypothetical protein
MIADEGGHEDKSRIRGGEVTHPGVDRDDLRLHPGMRVVGRPFLAMPSTHRTSRRSSPTSAKLLCSSQSARQRRVLVQAE